MDETTTIKEAKIVHNGETIKIICSSGEIFWFDVQDFEAIADFVEHCC